MKLSKITCLLVFSLLLTGCGRLVKNQKTNKENNNIRITRVEFDSIYRDFHATVQFSPSLSSLFLQEDSTLEVKVKEFVDEDKINLETQPELINVTNVRKEQIQACDMNVVALVDLSLKPEFIEHQKRIVKELAHIVSDENLKIAFYKDGEISETMKATDYVIEKYFKQQTGDVKYFYKGLLTKYEELVKYQMPIEDDQASDLDSIFEHHKLLIVLSDGKVYDNRNQPIDPEHFQLQRDLVSVVDSVNKVPIMFFDLKHKENDEAKAGDSDDLLKLLCDKSGGKYIDSYEDDAVIYNLLDLFKEHFLTYHFYFQNPDHKVYRGNECKLEISCFKGDSLLASDYIDYYVGSVYNPVIVNGRSTIQVIVIGLLIGILCASIVYLILQFVVPFISYILFKRKYVTHYTGKNMSFNDVVVPKECYFCKAPFEKDDEIVVKCQHVVHKSCWDENEYKCPEYGRNCKHGSHYYNQEKLYDFRNAPFFLSWVLAGACAALISWIFFISLAHNSQGIFFAKAIPMIFNVDPTSEEALDLIDEYGSHLLFLPFYGLNMGFFLTFFLSLLTSHGRWWWKRILLVLTKALIGGSLGCLAFLLGSVISIALNFTDNSFLVDWIPWLLSGFSITLVVAFGTDIKLKKALIGAFVSVILGLGSTYIWTNPYDSQFDTRNLLLLSYMIYCVGFAISIAITYPKSERYFLRVEGPIKEMDIALYKWMNARLVNKYIFIGKSVDCELQMTWDITSAIAPKQAKVVMINGNIYLEALDSGILMDGEELVENKRIRLYHGTKFVIGKTIFTYLEKDV